MSLTRTRRALAASTLLALLGCDLSSPFRPLAGTISFDVVEDAYAPGDFVDYRLTNHSLEHYVYNLCFAVLMRSDGDQWVVAGSSETCLAIGYRLDPGASVTGRERLPTDLPPGHYRFFMGGTDRRGDLHTRAFLVE